MADEANDPNVVPIPPPNTGAEPKPPVVAAGAALAPKAINTIKKF